MLWPLWKTNATACVHRGEANHNSAAKNALSAGASGRRSPSEFLARDNSSVSLKKKKSRMPAVTWMTIFTA